MSKIDIIIPAWNAVQWIDTCLKSIATQQSKHVIKSVLLGIDACEVTLKKIEDIYDVYKQRLPGFRVLYFNNNVGPYIVRNTLAGLGDAEYIATFDADDEMLPQYIGTLYSYRKKFDVIRCKQIRAGNLDGTQNSHGQILVRRTVFESLGGYREWRCAADSEFMDRAKRQGYFVGVARTKPIMKRRGHPRSLTQHPDTGRQSEMRSKYNTLRKQSKMKNDNIAPYIKTDNYYEYKP